MSCVWGRTIIILGSSSSNSISTYATSPLYFSPRSTLSIPPLHPAPPAYLGRAPAEAGPLLVGRVWRTLWVCVGVGMGSVGGMMMVRLHSRCARSVWPLDAGHAWE